MDLEFNKSQRILIAVILAVLVIAFISVFSFRSHFFPPRMLGTPTHEHIGIPDSQKKVIRVGGDDAYPPFSYLENGEAKGFDNDLMRAVADVMGVNIEFQLSPWNDVKQALLDGKIDVINGMAYSADRDAFYDFSVPYNVLYFDLFVRKKSNIVDFADLTGKRVIIQRGGIMEEYLKNSNFTGGIIKVETPLEALQLLASGKYDGALLNKMQGYYIIDTYHLNNLRSTDESINSVSYAFAVKNGNNELRQELNQALATVDKTGVYDQLVKKWFSPYLEKSFFEQARNYIYAGIGLVLFSIIILSWLWTVRRTVRKRTQELRASEEKYRLLIQNAAEGVIVISSGKIVYVNPLGREILGLSSEEQFDEYKLNEIVPDEDLRRIRHTYASGIKNETNPIMITTRIQKGSKETRWVKANLVRMDWEGKPAVLCFFADITEERLADDKIRASEERYRLLFAKSPVGLFYYDNDLKITSTNEIVCQILRTSRETLEGFNLNQIEDKRILPALRAILDHEEGYYEGPFTPFSDLASAEIYILLHTMPLFNERYEYKGGIAQFEDLTDQVKSEHKIQNLEERFTKAFYTTPDAININRLTDGVYIDCNRSFIELSGYSREEIIGESSLTLKIWCNPEDRAKLVRGLSEYGEVKNLEAEFRKKSGEIITGLMSASIIEIDGEKCILSITRDITDIKKAQNVIRESEVRYRTIFNSVPVSLWEQDFSTVYDMLENIRAAGVTNLQQYLDQHPEFVTNAVKTVTVKDMNDESIRIFKAKTKKELFSSIDIMFTDESYHSFRNELQAIWERKPIYNGETINQTLEGDPIIVNVLFRIPEKREDFAHIFVNIMDVTAQKAAEEQIKRQVQYLAALRAVDMAISASMDLPIVLRVLLNQVQQQLKVHSASILLFKPLTQKLEFAAGSGFKTRAVEGTNLALGESYAGKAALERRIIAADDLSASTSQITTEGFKEDGFTDYLGIPLISKGVVKGVLEIFNKGKLPQDEQWMSLLDSMASQAAIAIDNASLFNEAQKANTSLRQAYDATIEGWARALELRDGDTEGHSERVAAAAIQLARMVGVPESEMVDLRRGALLHDIGKMGISDAILLKPAPLTDEEWAIMRTHPTLGKEMLETIDFLRNSLDIPWCHHERWDGTGYPRGLKGTEIPLMARVFSVIDGWDALRSDRPYRKGMSDADAWKVIEENSGKAYDPEIVEKFRIMVKRG